MREELRNKIYEISKQLTKKESALLPALLLIQNENGYISNKDMKELSKILKLPEANVFSTASYYSMLSLKPIGKYNIQVCTNIVCSLLVERPLIDYISETLGIQEGETTPDGIFSLTGVECLASCGDAPAMQINLDRYENLTYEKVDEIITSLSEKEMHKK